MGGIGNGNGGLRRGGRNLFQGTVGRVASEEVQSMGVRLMYALEGGKRTNVRDHLATLIIYYIH